MNVPKTQIVLTTLFVLSSTFSYSNNNMSSFYSESTFLALIILSIVLIAISVLLYGIKRHLTVLNNEKNKQVAEPSLYERKFRPIIEAWNPTIATLIIDPPRTSQSWRNASKSSYTPKSRACR